MRLVRIDDFNEYGEPIYGMVVVTRNIYINIERIWQDSKTEEDFIKNYASIITHEYLHKLIGETISELYENKEEDLVDTLSNSENIKVGRKYLFMKHEDN